MKSEANKKKNRYERFMTEKQNQFMAMAVTEFLMNHRRGYQWAATVEGNVLYIMNLDVSNSGCEQIPVRHIDPTLKKVLWYADEYLERYGLPRGPKDNWAMLRLTTARRDMRGDMVPYR